MALTDYGWRTLYGSVTTDTLGTAFTEESVLIHGRDSWKNIDVSADFSYKGSDIGIVLCYNNTIGYLLFAINKTTARLFRASILSDDGTTVTLGNRRVLRTAELTAELINDTAYTLRVERIGTNVKCYVDDTLVINTEESLYGKGQIGVYGNAGELCTGISVSQPIPSLWTIANAREADLVCTETNSEGNTDIYIKPCEASTNIVGVKQTVNTVDGQAYAVACKFNGAKLWASLGSTADSYTPAETGEHTATFVFTASGSSNDLILGSKDVAVTLHDVQVELKPYSTSYVYNDSLTDIATREDTVVTYPAEGNINASQGSISLWIKPMIDYSSMDLTAIPAGIFYYGENNIDRIRIYYDGTDVVFQYQDANLPYTIALEKGEIYHIVATWDIPLDTIRLFVANQDDLVDEFDMGIVSDSDIVEVNTAASTIDIGGDIYSKACDAALDNLIIYKRALSDNDIYNLFISESEPVYSPDMILRANFNNDIGNFNWSSIDITPAPLPGTPIIVKKADGTIMRKVSFAEAFSNQYVPYYRQDITYTGGQDIIIATSNIDYDYPNTGLYTFGGIKIAGLDAIDHSYHGNIIHLKGALDDKYIGQNLIAWYQPKDCYTVDFNTGEDTCRITLGKNEGDPVTIIYEANPYIGDYALAETVDLNALNNPNHQGFMYITQSVDTAEIFRINVSPDEFVANGFNYAVIVMEVVDKYGNPVSDAEYEMTTPAYGTLQPYYSPKFTDYLARKTAYITLGHTEDEWYANYGHYIGLNEMAGRQIFLYKANRLTPGTVDEVTERILVKDKISGLGTEISIRLVIKSDYKLTN